MYKTAKRVAGDFYYNFLFKVLKTDPISGYKIHPVPKPVFFGSETCGLVVPGNFLKASSVAYLAGVGEDVSFDVEIVEKYDCNAYLIDPTPRAKKHVEELIERTKKGEKMPVNNSDTHFYTLRPENTGKLHFAYIGLWNEETTLRFYEPKNPEFVSYSIVNLQQTENYIDIPTKRLSTLMKEYGHHYIDLLKLDIEGAEYEVLDSIFEDRLDIGCIVVGFHQTGGRSGKQYKSSVKKYISRLIENGYIIITADLSGGNYTLIKQSLYKQL